MAISVKSNQLHEWHDLVCEARGKLGYGLCDDLESYLILTLNSYTTDRGLPRSILSIDFLNAANDQSTKQIDKLRTTGDRCLLISGLFPERAEYLNVNNAYFIGMGQQAYYTIAITKNKAPHRDLFVGLGDEFVKLTHILLTMRTLHE